MPTSPRWLWALRRRLAPPRGIELVQSLGVFVVELLEYAARKIQRLRLPAAVGNLAAAGVIIEVGLVTNFQSLHVTLALRRSRAFRAKKGFPVRIDAIEDPIRILQEQGADLLARVAREIPGTGGDFDMEIRILRQAVSNALEIVLETSEMRAEHHQVRMLLHDVVPGRDDRRVARVLGL